jgi:hypothetical protein
MTVDRVRGPEDVTGTGLASEWINPSMPTEALQSHKLHRPERSDELVEVAHQNVPVPGAAMARLR